VSVEVGEHQVGAHRSVRSKDLFEHEIRFRREIQLTLLGVGVTAVAAALFTAEISVIVRNALDSGATRHLLGQGLFAATVVSLVFGNLAYQLARLGYLVRLREYRAAPRNDLERIYDSPAPRLAILVPSYKEEERVIEQSLWSAALQRYPDRRVVLLIDDPPAAPSEEERRALVAARQLPSSIMGALSRAGAGLAMASERFLERKLEGRIDLSEEYRTLSDLHAEVAAWFETRARDYTIHDHVDREFVALTFERPAREHRLRAQALRQAANDGRTGDQEHVAHEYRILDSLFRARLTSFERKRFENLSHEPNKAMNLNSYIDLLGRRFREVERAGSWVLEEASPGEEELDVEWADYLITLDADSILAHDYALRLVHVMEQPGNERLAVAQTPYSAFADPSRPIERIAGATTDMQYVVHQGFTRAGATFWVGANALLRTRALQDIATTRVENGHTVRLYISDRTVIEDTESSVDLVVRGWRLYNYPRRLSISATPADFGSLVVQRRRWANGGLIILPKLIRFLLESPKRLRRIPEAFMRIHYLTSIALVNTAVPILLIYPFEDNLWNLWLPLTALPHFLLYGRDLVLTGYRRTDLLRVYALNLMLIPVNLGGVLKSLQQAVTRRRIPFKRTPKISGVTTAPAVYILAEIAIPLGCLIYAAIDLHRERWMHGAFTLVNAGFFLYALAVFVRPAESLGYRSEPVVASPRSTEAVKP
jgi:cellulose synthase/poly-beta-1,6-N-acetylglucosamine synthase-like glycosyltransferase